MIYRFVRAWFLPAKTPGMLGLAPSVETDQGMAGWFLVRARMRQSADALVFLLVLLFIAAPPA
jgi:hypothetical protein